MCVQFGSSFAQFCPRIWDPVCGVNPFTRSVRTFPNLCELQNNVDSEFGRYRLFHKGECQQHSRHLIEHEEESSELAINSENNGRLHLVCPPIYKPVCGVDRRTGKQRTFSNECILIHESFNYDFLHEGVCHGVPDACTLQWEPVCAVRLTDGSQKTFSNECWLRLEQAANPHELFEFYHEGECNEHEIQPFGRSLGRTDESEGEELTHSFACPLIWRPVCAVRLSDKSHKTFSNDCFLRNQQPSCDPRDRYIFLHEGECQQH